MGKSKHLKNKSEIENSIVEGTIEKGTWVLTNSQLVIWEIEKDNTIFRYTATIHYNTFGESPRMYGGMIIRDRYPNSFLPSWLFRPVLGTFFGEGIQEYPNDNDKKNLDE